ncbi:hypothetical protein SLEP1_g28816 [Rubroshorea leprosula]|uniref:Uncharacterized protein n=1 Tax=Rubroshorea leprosula TaxID=152421 RepID=A0AAV5JUV1_9ROSI|nr:hypothetical protein SLEP1_g28816 [Rubroshorea leprosula]
MSQVLGEATNTTTSILETAASAIQGFGPINQIHQHLCVAGVPHLGEPVPDAARRGEATLWHSHEYEVKSGVLFMPGIQRLIQGQDMEKVCKTHGKVFHFWQVDKGDNLPLGLPQLMVALTRDGQLHDELGKNVEKQLGISLAEERGKREYMKGTTNGIHPLANGGGKGFKTELRETESKPAESLL